MLLAQFRLFPPTASTTADQVDHLYFFLCAVAAFFTVLIFGLIAYFAIRYRRRSATPPPPQESSYLLEAVWTLVPFAISMLIFFWGARVYYFIYRPPPDALEVHVIGKQWMWKVQHANGRREINELHVPLGQPVQLILASQDVIHSFYIPAFRVKQDVLPGRYTVEWFEPSRLGEYHLFCAEYCGTNHSAMVGRVVVMEPDRYQAWLTGTAIGETPAEAGARLFDALGCRNCHGVKAPTLAGLYRSEVKLTDGRTLIANEDYLRESILDSTARIVAGYSPIMPSFRAQVSEEQLADLIAYIKSLQAPQALRKVE